MARHRRHRLRGFGAIAALPRDLLEGHNLGVVVGGGLAVGVPWAARKLAAADSFWAKNSVWLGLGAGVVAGLGLTMLGKRAAGATTLLTSIVVGGLQAARSKSAESNLAIAGSPFGLLEAREVSGFGAVIEAGGVGGPLGLTVAQPVSGYLGQGGGDDGGLEVSGPGGTVGAFGAGPMGWPGY